MKAAIIQLILKWACGHKWEIHHRTNVFSDNHKLPDAIKDTLICTKCGEIKRITL